MSAFRQALTSVPSTDSSTWIYIHPDQLNPDLLLACLPEGERHNAGFLFVESSRRWNQLPFHKKRIIFEMSSMRHLAVSLANQGHPVHYAITDIPFQKYLNRVVDAGKVPESGIFSTTATDETTEANAADEANAATEAEPSSVFNTVAHNNQTLKLHLMQPASMDERNALNSVTADNCSIHPNTFFLADSSAYTSKISPGYRMEYFYRDMRKQLDLLMEPNGEPAGGEWNFDKDNRKALPRKIDLPALPELGCDELTAEVSEVVTTSYPNHFGLATNFSMAVSRADAEKLADHFFECSLANFGPYEDAMAKGEAYVFHSALSAYMNIGLLDPLTLCRRAEQAWREGDAPLNSVEGFIRQIIGWREFIRIYYEAMMPDVREANALKFTRGLPQAYWTADSGMACIDDIVGGVKELAWSHHIPRLMVLSNFSNLTESDPYQLYLWFWYGYSDAHDWVVLPNVLGMSTFADGGVLASKPYVSGGNYINKMSNYCTSCRYNIKEKTGETACPFNYLYWNFVDNHREVFNENGRVSFMVNMFDKRKDEDKEAIRMSAQKFIDELPRWKPVQIKHDT